MDTPVAPSAGWWSDGLLASFRGAVGDPDAPWERAMFTSREGLDERLAARLVFSSDRVAGGEPGSESEPEPQSAEPPVHPGAEDKAAAPEWVVVDGKDGGLVVTLHLPLLETMAGAELEVSGLTISFSAAPHYAQTAVELPSRVDTEQSTAKFSRRSRTLRLKLPAIK